MKKQIELLNITTLANTVLSLTAFLIVLTVSLESTPVFARDLGVYGHLWSISEVNLKKVIATQLSHVNMQKIGLTLKKQARNFGNNLPPNELPIAQKTQTIYVDPSIALKHDIIIRGKLIYKKGSWVNPLTYIKPVTDMLFFNGDDSAQLNFALKALKDFPYKLMLVMIKGNPVKLAAKIHRPVYFGYKTIIKRFHITKVPSLLGIGKGQLKDRLAVTTFSKPYLPVMVKRCWHGC